jgi:uncharacterized protein with LGFP repeats
MSGTLEQITTGERRGLVGLVSRVSERFGPVGRRGFFVGAAVAGSALATDPKAYALRPQTAYSTICGPGNTASSGWTVFCSTINKGVNSCPPGSFAAGWWKAAGSSWCGGGYRYIVDCNASCSKCSSGCSGDHICDKGCWNCSCGTGSTATCDQRRICCNAFRYGQCNTQVKCSGGVHCRVVSCVPPYTWANCTTTSLRDDRTAEHSAPSLPKWGYIAAKYKAMGEQRSFLKASRGPVYSVGDNRGSYVLYQGGAIYYTSSTGAVAVAEYLRKIYAREGGPKGCLGYPRRDRVTGLRDGGWLQEFETGALTDSASTATQSVWGVCWDAWRRDGRENGNLGYPIGPRTALAGGAWIQMFQTGAITDTTSTTPQVVWGVSWDLWRHEGRENGNLGFPTGPRTALGGGAWIQLFQRGAIIDTPTISPKVVWGAMYTGWVAAGREKGVLGYPTGPAHATSRGSYQTFQAGDLWRLGSGAARRVYGGVLSQWKAAGGATGTYGYPLTDTISSDGRLTCTFEGGTITA